MKTAFEIAALILIPQAWGLLVEFLFELRRRRAQRRQEGFDDWVI